MSRGTLFVLVVLFSGVSTAAIGLDSRQAPAGYAAKPSYSTAGAFRGNPSFLIVEDASPWSEGTNQAVLDSLIAESGAGFAYTQITMDEFITYDLAAAQTKVIIIASDQPQSFYDRLHLVKTKLRQFVQAGGVIVAHACDNGWADSAWAGSWLPGGLKHQCDAYFSDLRRTWTNHRIMSGVSQEGLDDWNYSAHGFLTYLPTNARVIVTANEAPYSGKPVYVEYSYGSGRVLATTMTLDWSQNQTNIQTRQRMLRNELRYALRPDAVYTSPTNGGLVRANFHTHSSASTNGVDHRGAPTANNLLTQARNHGLDCLAVTDHAEAVSGLEWQNIDSAIYSRDDIIGLRGFEWTYGFVLGAHVNVLGSDALAVANTDGEGGWGDHCPGLSSLYAWLPWQSKHYDVPIVGQFNHIDLPQNVSGTRFNNFTRPNNEVLRQIMALAELAIGSEGAAQAQARQIPDDPRDGEVQWKKALAKGWYVAPSYGSDNYANLPASARRCHTGVYLLPGEARNREGVLAALAQRRTFASQDANAQIQLFCNGAFMGSRGVPATNPIRMTLRYAPGIGAKPLDATYAYRKLVIDGADRQISVTPRQSGAFWIFDIPLPQLSQGSHYVYARLRQADGHWLWSAPIWLNVKATAAPAVAVASVTAAATPAGGAQITYTLSAPADVSVAITNIAGRSIRSLPETTGQQGLNTLLWDGKSASGLPVPSGRYLIRVLARNEGGTQAQGMTACSIQRH